jgi:hypothetical protein
MFKVLLDLKSSDVSQVGPTLAFNELPVIKFSTEDLIDSEGSYISEEEDEHQEDVDCGSTLEMSGDHRTVIKGSPSQYVKLNVGGSLHYTTIGTLTKHDTMLRAMFSGRMEVLTDSEGN